MATLQVSRLAGIEPVGYIKDTCQILRMRWDENNSAPGTIVVPLMFHSIVKTGKTVSDDTSITEEYYQRFIVYARQLGFTTITSEQLVGFLQKNAKIPARSMIIIVDDRKRAEFFDTYFVPNFKSDHWTVTNAWIAHPDTPAYLYQENEQFVPTGMIDFQAHGMIHNVPIDASVTDEYMRGEIFGPLQPIQQHFGKLPIAFIWPRGLFTPKAVALARSAGYQVGFTVFSRGPLLFNWIPLGADERAAADPLLVLPRYWSTAAIAALNDAVLVSQAAETFYARQKPVELAYYQQYCQKP
jgi:hypothetical protein